MTEIKYPEPSIGSPFRMVRSRRCRAPIGQYGVVLIGILVFLALMMLVPLTRTAMGAKLARSRAIEIGTPMWIPWTTGLLAGGAVLAGAFLGGAGNSIPGTASAVVAAILLAAYMMWRAGLRRAASDSADHPS